MAVPTYHRAPHFSIPPPPQGPLQLGVVVGSLDQLIPLNRPDQLPVAVNDIFCSSVTGFRQTTSSIKSRKWALLATLLGLLAPGTGAVAAQTEREETLSIETIDTSYFTPTDGFIEEVMRLSAARAFLEATRYKKPIYLITGLKVARGASANIINIRTRRGNVGLGGQLGSPSHACLQGQTRAFGQTSFESSTDFVLGFRVTKIKVTRSGGSSSQPHTRGATFYGAEGEDKTETLAAEVCHDYANSDAEGGGGLIEIGEEIAGFGPARWVINGSA